MNKTLLSICIPTFNRIECLDNCLKSIKVASENYKFNFEVCIKDNNSEGNAYSIVKKYQNCFAWFSMNEQKCDGGSKTQPEASP